MIFAIAIGAASVLGWYALSGDNELLAVVVLFAGLAMAVGVGFVSQWVALARSVWQWVQIVRSKPGKVTVRSVHPPKGFIFRRDAIVEMEVADEGRSEVIEQGISIPFLPALAWRVLGRVPTPIGRLTDRRELNARVWGRS